MAGLTPEQIEKLPQYVQDAISRQTATAPVRDLSQPRKPKRNRADKPVARPEQIEQEEVIGWARRNEDKYPELRLLYGNMNGVKLGWKGANKAKKAGNKPGLPDLSLYVKRDGFSGLFIEMKRSDKRYDKKAVTKEQRETIELLRDNQYYVEVCYSAEEAISELLKYLALPKTQFQQR